MYSTLTNYRTVVVSMSTATVVPVQSSVAPYPTGSATSANAGTTGTGSPVVGSSPLATYVGSGAERVIVGPLVLVLGVVALLL